MMPTATCQYCGWNGPADRCGRLLENTWERVQPGDTMPAGECPKCNASAMLDEPTNARAAHRDRHHADARARHAFRGPLDRAGPRQRHVHGPQHVRYRVQDMDVHGFRVAVYRQNPYPPMVPDGYLRIEPA